MTNSSLAGRDTDVLRSSARALLLESHIPLHRLTGVCSCSLQTEKKVGKCYQDMAIKTCAGPGCHMNDPRACLALHSCRTSSDMVVGHRSPEFLPCWMHAWDDGSQPLQSFYRRGLFLQDAGSYHRIHGNSTVLRSPMILLSTAPSCGPTH